ncbi:unnamed protein product [Auanema sp. JU1783]|nr:unnamed protein product [Auanema sp. JU1783]
MEPFNSDIYEGYNLYIHPDKFYLEPRDREGGLLSTTYLEIDRHYNTIRLGDANVSRIPVSGADLHLIRGILGTIQLVSGMALIVIKRIKQVGSLNGHHVWSIVETEVIPYKKTLLHLTEKQIWYNRLFTDMIQTVLSTGGFYFSHTLDLSRSLQWLSENASPEFRQRSMIDRCDERFVWNRHLLSAIRSISGTARYCLPVIHGFYGQFIESINGQSFKVILVSRRSVHRAGVRFYKRGVCPDGNPANYVETEQIVELDKDAERKITAFLQLRGSIPLFWSQKPNLKWQPIPCMKPHDDQLQAYVKHFENQKKYYNGRHVIVSLINTHGREKRIGGELEKVSQQANLSFVRYNPFDFHKECKAMKWDRVSILKEQLRPEITEFGFFASSLNDHEFGRTQSGFFRTNCMDCLDRTNVIQCMLARESLTDQLEVLGILYPGQKVEFMEALEASFKNLWADNGDECSKQYAGTGALKADFTRLGKRTYQGALNDGINAITRYFRNNFADGYRQDAIDLFLGNFIVDPNNLPSTLETTLIALDQNGVALLAALFAMAMTVLCVLVAENISATLFWLLVFIFCVMFIFLNGEEFVNVPKLKKD